MTNECSMAGVSCARVSRRRTLRYETPAAGTGAHLTSRGRCSPVVARPLVASAIHGVTPMSTWTDARTVSSHKFRCGHCGAEIASEKGWRNNNGSCRLYICHLCDHVTYFPGWPSGGQIPSPPMGENVKHVPEEVGRLYDESRRCLGAGAPTLCCMGCRKLLLCVAAHLGMDQPQNRNFQECLDWLVDNNHVPTRWNAWVNQLRNVGNAATHEVPSVTAENAKHLVDFAGMLLRATYEFPGTVQSVNE